MNIWLVGGDHVIPTSVEKAIQGDGYTVKRISGEDRYETAAMVAEAGISLSGKKPSKVFVASGTSFADALAVSPVAFAKGYPIILTEKDSTSDFSKKELGNIGTDAKILVGGEAVVSKAVAANLSIKEDARVAGADRAVTANLVSDWAKKSEGFNPANAALVGGTNGNGADSLVAASLGGKSLTTLHFAGWDATSVYFKDHAAELTGKGFVFGGKAAVPGDQVDTAQAAAQTAVSNQSIKVSPSDSASVTVADETGDKATSDDRVYTASGLDSSLKYRVTLVKSTNLKTAADGSVTFTQDGSTGLVDPGTVTSDITVVNGVPTGAPGTHVQSVGGVSAEGGSLNFRVDGKGYETLVPVVYVDGGANTRLEIDAKGKPTEKFGLGGSLVVLPVEQTTGAAGVTAAVVKEVFKDGSFIAQVGAGSPFFYKSDANDAFTMDSAQATFDTFKSRLTVGDTVTVTDYQRDAALKSTFALTNVLPAALAVDSSVAGERSVVLTFDPADIADGATVNVYYAVDTDTTSATAPVYASTFTKKSFTADDDATTTGFQVTLSGLTAGTDYQLYTSQTTNGDESLKTGYEESTATDTAPAYVASSVTPNDVNDGIGSTSEVVVTFDQEVSVLDATKFTVYPTAQSSFVFNGVSAKKANTSGTKWIVTLDKSLQDASTDVGYTLTVGANAVQDASAMKNLAATDTFNY